MLKYSAKPGARKYGALSDGTKLSAQTSCSAQIERGLRCLQRNGVNQQVYASGLTLEVLASEAVIDSVEAKYGSYQEPQISPTVV